MRFEDVDFGNGRKKIYQDEQEDGLGKWWIFVVGMGRVGPFDTREEAEKESRN